MVQVDGKVANLKLELWDATHPRWPELMKVIDEEGQTTYITFEAEFHEKSYLLVALQGEAIAGFLRAVVQAIGPDMDCPPMTFRGKILTETKILAFAVRTPFQNQGVGKALQHELIRLAKTWQCYQVRSHSDGYRKANHHLKVSLGFAIHPIVRGNDTEGAYFIMPLIEESQHS